jgi:3-hydroxyacyl-CoA dehydrogenase
MKAIKRVGLIGLGKMGLPMARRLAERGFAVTGTDRDAAGDQGGDGAWHRYDRFADTARAGRVSPNGITEAAPPYRPEPACRL